MEDTLKQFICSMDEQLMLFHLLAEEEVGLICPFLERIRYQAGSTVFNEGEVGDYMAFIVSGLLEVKKETEFKGRQVVLAKLKPGSFVGEMSLVNEKELRSATVIALDDSELLILKRDALDALVEKHPHIGIKILKGLNRILAIRLRKAVERLTTIF